MVPITEATQPGQPGYTWQHFESRLHEICQEHHDERRALAFAVILHDETNPAVRKVLQDRAYWDALNAFSGHFLTVFSFETPPAKPEPLEFMTTVSTPTYKPRSVAERHFGIPHVSLPAILFFQATEDGVIGHCLVDLPDGTVEATYQALQKAIRTAAESVSSVTPDNRGNYEEMFSLVRGAIESQRTGARVWNAVRSVRDMAQVISLLRGLF